MDNLIQVNNQPLTQLAKFLVSLPKITNFTTKIHVEPSKEKEIHMIIITAKEKENIDRTIKRYKQKVEKTRLVQELRQRREHKTNSRKRKEELEKAKRRQQFEDNN